MYGLCFLAVFVLRRSTLKSAAEGEREGEKKLAASASSLCLHNLLLRSRTHAHAADRGREALATADDATVMRSAFTAVTHRVQSPTRLRVDLLLPAS